MAEVKKDLPLDEARAKLKQHFGGYSDTKYTEGWAKLWADGSFLPWDRNKPSPALADTLENYYELVGNAMVDGRRKKALVPGCGRGVDVLLLESFGYDAVGLEVSEGAVKAAEAYAKEHGSEYPVRNEKIGAGSKKFLLGDFYKDDFLKDVGMKEGEKFDLIYDYTCEYLAPFTRMPQLQSTALTRSCLFSFLCNEPQDEADVGSENVRSTGRFSTGELDMS
jgi:hypothetical protein